MADILHISSGTVRWHLANLRKLYNVHSTRELLILFIIQEKHEQAYLKISDRSKEVIDLFMNGKTYAQIASHLGISVSGVRRHIEKCLIQNNCKSTIELISKYRSQCKV
ncbi:LuxR C-terminal-related transcriptional regulator [uncultured Mailhella sp.]|uniref:helix-turn-helix transcriptional regulator n=1 Tax=uncultured Mailhella sp. TaxID=1981031 RepID=UPI003457E071